LRRVGVGVGGRKLGMWGGRRCPAGVWVH
jgi:hypothetical protein